MSDGDLIARLSEHRTLAHVPREELEWLASHGTLVHYTPGTLIAKKGEPIDGIYIVLHGRVSHFNDQSGTPRRVLDWRDGEVTGQLPYSRMVAAPGNSVVEEPSEVLHVDARNTQSLPVHCPHVTEALVHAMVDRARAFKSSDLQVEKMASLGKLAAGLAHELNNPASAAARSAQLISQALAESDDASRALGAAQLDANERSLIDRLRDVCVAAPATAVRTPLERADREEEIGAWLAAHGVDESFAASLAETDLEPATLDEAAGALHGEKLSATLRWLAAACTIRALAREIERAASRVHALVSAVKGFTYMDHATAPEPVDVKKGLTDTLAVMAAKARSRLASLTIDVPDDLPQARGFGGELNQVWANLVDNALDAIREGGRVTVSARADGGMIVVRVIDDGPGVPAELKNRIFEPFFTTKPVGKGTGLGLDIVRRLVDRNDGMLDLDSDAGRTEFRVSIPLAK